MNYPRLFEPFSVKGLTLKNRIVMPAIHHHYTEDGYANERFMETYFRRAEGGAALIFVGGCRFDDYGAAAGMISLRDDSYIPGYRTFTDGMHARGSLVGVQLYHAGAYTHRSAISEGRPAMAPSEILSPFTKEMPQAMSIQEIHTVIENWAAGALRAKKAGFDIVEILASAGYLICQFLSPLRNLRQDEYGGSWENRTRFAREVVAAVRQAVGEDYPICMRIAGNDFVPGSNTNENAVEFCQMMEECGVDLFNVTGGWHETVVPQLTGDLPRGGFSYLSAAIRDAVHVPVIVSNRINHPAVAERMLALGMGDLVGVGRALIADPAWPKKSREHTPIRMCVACNQGCLANIFFDRPLQCLVNPLAGRETQFSGAPCKRSHRILVVGGGPAGCEFALRAAQRGCTVTLWEKAPQLGGDLLTASLPPSKSEFHTLINYYQQALPLAGISVHTGKEGRAEDLAPGDFDLVVCATGARENTLPIPGDGSTPVLSAHQILLGHGIAGRDVVILGGGSVGCECAQYLAHEGSLSPEQVYFLLSHKAEETSKVLSMMNSSRRNISIVDPEKIGKGFAPGTGWPVMKNLARFGVKKYPGHLLTDLRVGQATIRPTGSDAAPLTLPCDTVVLAVGSHSDATLAQQLQARGIPTAVLGDAKTVGKILDALRDATELAMSLE